MEFVTCRREAKAMKATNVPEPDKYLNEFYGRGWEVAYGPGVGRLRQEKCSPLRMTTTSPA